MNTWMEKQPYLQAGVSQGSRIKSMLLDGRTKAEKLLPQNNRDTRIGKGRHQRKQYLCLRHLIAKPEHRCAKTLKTSKAQFS